MAVLRWTVLLLAGCIADVNYGGTSYQCGDGQGCPSDYTCVAELCVPDGEPPPIDAGDPDVDAGFPIDPPMIDIPASSFVQGCQVIATEDCLLDAVPNESISLSAYRIDRHEVTQADYAVCVDNGACTAPDEGFDPTSGPLLPVAGVTHAQATAFCAWIGRRLPTESEWERAARGTDQRTYPWGEDDPSCERAVLDGCGERQPVESLTGGISPVGAFDMAGNVAEWVADFYSPAYYPTGPNVDPPGPSSGQDRVVRGGGFASDPEVVRTFHRDKARPDDVNGARGFRCAE